MSAAINLGLANPLAHRLRAADPQEPRDFADRRPLRLVLSTAPLRMAHWLEGAGNYNFSLGVNFG